MNWLASSWHKLCIVALMLDHLWDRLEPLLKRFAGAEEFIERRFGGDRRNHMEVIKLITEGPKLVESIIQLEKDLQADWALVAPNNPKLAQDIATIKAAAFDIFGTPPVKA